MHVKMLQIEREQSFRCVWKISAFQKYYKFVEILKQLKKK